MKTKTNPTSLEKETTRLGESIKLGIDVHKEKYVIVCQYDCEAPKSPQSLRPEAFLAWIARQVGTADWIHTCYEAGCFGYVLHRKLEALGAKKYVVRPRNWDDYGSKVKTDARDARELCSHLDRYIAGNKRASSVDGFSQFWKLDRR